MELIIIVLALVLIGFMALCWWQSDMCKELQEKNEAANEEIVRLQQCNHLLEAENKALRSNLNTNNEIICYDCAENGECTEGGRFTTGAKGCRKHRRQDE